MPDLTVSANVDTLMQAANFAAFRTSLGLGALATITPGTGIATALAINVGSAGAPLLFNGAGGTPSSMVGTNITGTAAGLTAGVASAVAIGGITGLGTGVATFLVTPSSANLAAAVTGETGTGALVFGSSPTIDAATLTGTTTASTVNTTNANVTNLLPVSNDGAAIGASGTAFSDLFLASGGVINFGAGNLTLTHSAGVLTSNGAYVGTTGTFASTTSLLLGTAGSAVGNVGFRNATSGTITVAPVTGALGTVTLSLPAVTATICAAATSTTTTQALFATSTAGAPAYRSITAADVGAGILAGNVTLGESTGQIVLDPTLSADGTWSGIMEAGTAGTTLAFGDVCYLAAADSRWELTDADASATSGPVKIGICVLAAAADGDPTAMLLFGKIRADAAFPTFTVSAPVFLSGTAGDVTNTAPSATDSVTRICGYGNTGDVLFWCPDPTWITHT